MKKRQLIATLACLLVGMAGFAGAYTMEQTDQSQTQQAEIPATEISQVSGVIEPETEDNSGDADTGEESTKSSSESDAKDYETQSVTTASSDGTGGGTDQENNSEAASAGAVSESGGNTDASNVDIAAIGGEDATDSNADTDTAEASADTADSAVSEGVNGESGDESTEDDVETVDADVVHFAADLRWPLEAGSVILDYSMDHMVYFETLEQYQYNPAMVISAEVGDKVYVVAEGMITDISTNEVTGLTVTEDLGDGYTAIYGQLSDVNFAVGDTVERGHVLGYVAETTKYYSVEGTNLYFAMELNGESINPLEYFAD